MAELSMIAERGSDALQMGVVTKDAGGTAVPPAADGAAAAVLNMRRRNASGSANLHMYVPDARIWLNVRWRREVTVPLSHIRNTGICSHHQGK